MIFSSLVPTLIQGYLKNEYLKINDILLVKKKEWCLKLLWFKAFFFIAAGAGAGVGAGAKNTRSRSR